MLIICKGQLAVIALGDVLSNSLIINCNGKEEEGQWKKINY